MSGSWFARPVGWNLGRVSHSARVAGAQLAVARVNGGDAGPGLVLGSLTWRPMEFLMAPASHGCAGWFNIIVSCALGPQIRRAAGSKAILDPASDGHGNDSERR